jgi:hypothetical protein
MNSDNEYFIEARVENGWLSRNARARKVVKGVVMKFRWQIAGNWPVVLFVQYDLSLTVFRLRFSDKTWLFSVFALHSLTFL